MNSWTADAPTALEFDEVTELNVRLMAGTVAVLVSDERPSLVVSEMSGDITLDAVAGDDARVRPQSTSGAVRTDSEALRTVGAPASHTVSGNVGAGTGRVSVTTMSGAVTLLKGTLVEMESETS